MTDWYRYNSHRAAHVDEYGDVSHVSSYVQLHKFKVIRTTPKGVWLELPMSTKPKFVLDDITHRGRAFAAPTILQAAEDFRLRKQFRIDRLQHQINNELEYLRQLQFVAPRAPNAD